MMTDSEIKHILARACNIITPHYDPKLLSDECRYTYGPDDMKKEVAATHHFNKLIVLSLKITPVELAAIDNIVYGMFLQSIPEDYCPRFLPGLTIIEVIKRENTIYEIRYTANFHESLLEDAQYDNHNH